jgi:hypothetical protein
LKNGLRDYEKVGSFAKIVGKEQMGKVRQFLFSVIMNFISQR